MDAFQSELRYAVRSLRKSPFGVRTYAVITFVVVPCVLLSIAFGAAWVPARHFDSGRLHHL